MIQALSLCSHLIRFCLRCKLKLILSGFHEGALAARACFKLARPNEKYRFEFTTSSKTIKERLGVKGD